jgi:hypothetical protein
MSYNDFGMASKRRSTWKDADAVKLFKMCKENTPVDTIYKEFPNRKEKLIKNKIHMMGFSVKNLGKEI